MTAGHDTPVEPLPTGTSERQRWRWSMDFDDDFGGGFAFGRFLLRDDGALLCTHGDDTSRWYPLRAYDPVLPVSAVAADLVTHRYELFEPDSLTENGLAIPWHERPAAPKTTT